MDEQPGRISRTVAALRRLDSGERPAALALRAQGHPEGLQAYLAEHSG